MKRLFLAFCAIGVLGGCRPPAPKVEDTSYTVKKDSVKIQVVETGAVDAVRVVDVKSRVAGRVKQILVEEGDEVKKGDLIAVIDPKETTLQVEQNRAQLRGALAGVRRTSIEIEQRRMTAKAQYDQAQIRLAQLQKEYEAQPTLTRTAITSAQANYQSALQSKRSLVEATHPNETSQVQAELDQAKASYDNALRELKRLESLLGQDFVSRREYDNQKLQVDVALSRLTQAQDHMRRLDNQHALEVKSADERIRAAKADLDRAQANGVQDSIKLQDVNNAAAQVVQARAALKDVEGLMASREQSTASVDQLRSVLSDAERNLSETEIRAPMDGVITKKLVQEGELVASLSSFSSGTPIVRLEDRSGLIVKLNINEIDVAKLQLGMPATIDIDAIPSKSFEGAITKISPAKTDTTSASDAVVRFLIEVRLKESDSAIKSGMTAKCTMVAQSRLNVLVVPIDFFVKEGRDRFVMVAAAKKGEKAVKTKVTTGLESSALVEVVSGVAEGTKLERPDFKGPERRGAFSQ